MTTTINGRTPDEIKKGLECCSDGFTCPKNCPYGSVCGGARMQLNDDALTYIQQLERERDAAVERLHGWCEVCVHWENEDSIAFCDGCTHNYPFEHETNFADRWQWRGVPREEET